MKPESILALLIELGVKERKAWEMVGPVREWFDQMDAGMAEAMLPNLFELVRTYE